MSYLSVQSRWKSLLLVALAGAVALGSLVAVAMPGGLIRKPFAAVDGGLRWHESAASATLQQARAAGQLLDWLVVTGWAALTVGVVTVLALWGHLAAGIAPELVVHRAVGASRRSLLRQSLVIGLGLAAAAVVIGVLAGGLGGRAAIRTWPGPTPTVSWPSGLAVGIVALAALIGALFPLIALKTRRLAEPPPAVPPLTIPAIQLGLSLAITVTGAMVVRHARQADPGQGLAAAGWITMVRSSEADLGRRAESYARLLDTLAADGTVRASLTSAGTHAGLGTVDQLMTECGNCFVSGIYLKFRPLEAVYHTASADTFEARGLKVIEGRSFTPEDRIGSRPVAVVNVYLARRYFEAGEPIGRNIFLGGRMGTTPYQVVGVVDDGRALGFGGGLAPLEAVYLSTLQHPSTTMELAVQPRAGGALRPPSGPGISDGAISYAGYLAREREPLRWFGRWFEVEGALTLLLGVVGITSLMVLWVRALRPELGVRRAVGAGRWRTLGHVLGPAAKTGLAGGFTGLVFFGPVIWPEMSAVAPGISYWQPGLIAGIAAVLIAAAIGAALAPGWAASRATCVELWTEM